MLVVAAIDPLSAGAGDQVAVFTLNVNEVLKGDVLAVVRSNDILVAQDDLAQAGVTGLAGKREKIRNRTFISLASLAPDVKYEIDPKTVVLKIVVQAKHLGTESIDLRRVLPPPGLVYSHDTSFFLNYSLSTNDFKPSSLNSFNEAGISMFGNSLLDSAFSVDSTGKLTITNTTLTIDDREDLRRLTLGDVGIGGGDPFGGGGGIGGLGLSKNLGLDPYYFQTVGQDIRAELTSPSTVQLYVNGRRVFNENLPPGIFTLQNVPYVAGAGNTELVIRDAFGREEDFTAPYYYAAALLQPGVNTYNLFLGAEKLGPFDYNGPLVFSASDTFGFNNWVSPSLRLEGEQSGLVSGGLGLNFGIPYGNLSVTGAVSDSPMSAATPAPAGPTPTPAISGAQPIITASSITPSGAGGGRVMGYGALLGYSFMRPSYGIGGSVQWTSQHYANLSLTPEADRDVLQAQLGGNFHLSSRGSLAVSLQDTQDRDTGSRQTALLTSTWRLGELLSVYGSIEGSKTSRAPFSLTLAAGVGIALPQGSSANLEYQNQQGAQKSSVYSAQFSKSQPTGPGAGYFISAQDGTGGLADSAQILYRGIDTSQNLQINSSGSKNLHESYSLSGALVGIGGRLMPCQPIQGSFGLVSAGGLAGIEVFSSHQPVGETDSHGDLIVPQLASYYGNQLGVDDKEIPVEYRIDATTEYVAPPYHGGAVVAFPIRPVRSFVGKLQVMLQGRPMIPSFGQLTMTADGKSFISPLGRDGAFFLDSPPIGRYPARIDFDKGTCEFMINIPDVKRPFVRLGTMGCTIQ